MENLLKFEPRPLIDPNTKIALLWSAKAGSTFAVKWFFAQSGLLAAANFYRPFVHKYRRDVFYKSKVYLKAQINFLVEDYLLIKIVRSPFSRTVSSYIHALKYGYENKKLQAYFGRLITEESGFSFEEFINYLSQIDVSKCNIHHREQIHPLEAKRLIQPNYIVKLEESIESLQRIEAIHHLIKTPLESFRESSHNIKRMSGNEFCGDVRYTSRTDSFLGYKNFYNSKLIKQVISVYIRDFQAYNYSREL